MIAGEMPPGEMPAGEMLAGEMPAGEMPADEMPAGEIPAGDIPAGDTSTEPPQEVLGTCDQPLRPEPNEMLAIDTCTLTDQIDICGSVSQPDLHLFFDETQDCTLYLGEGILFTGRGADLCDDQSGGGCFSGVNTIRFSAPTAMTLEAVGGCRMISFHYTCP